jgi:dihydrodipicolinate synthase/N-acetylneuraminate lyase
MASFDATQLRGLFPPLATPLLPSGELDRPAFFGLVDHVLAGGVTGLFLLGTTGEGPSLSDEQRFKVVQWGTEAAAGRCPVLVAVSHPSLAESLRLANYAAECGASAIVATPPYYLPIDQAELVHYFQQLAERSPLPLVLYNMPSCVRTVIEPASVAALSSHPKILGMKDSSGQLAYFEQVCSQLPESAEFPILMGSEELMLAGMQRGATGGVCGSALLWPELFAAVPKAFAAGDLPAAVAADAIIQQITGKLHIERNGRQRWIESIKAALELKGLCRRWVLPPLQPLEESDLPGIQRQLEALDNIVRQWSAV